MDTPAHRKPTKRSSSSRTSFVAQWGVWLAGAGVVLAALVVYANSFSGVFIADDENSILNNPSIRVRTGLANLREIGQALSPPGYSETVSGRPLLNLSFAVNYAWGGINPWGYHATNLAIHILNALILLGILRRTFELPALKSRWGNAGLGLATAITLLWTVHPLQTESITYVVQRAESLGSFFYLLVLYAVIRGHSSGWMNGWYWVAGVACMLGAATKEIVATAPLVILLYDRTLLSGSFRNALRQRWGLYLGLAASWILLAGLVLHTGALTKSIAQGSENNVPPLWYYACIQPGVVLYYLRLAIWPYPLCLLYDWPLKGDLGAVLPPTILLPMFAVGVLLAVTAWGVWHRRPWSVAAASFFLILAPTSSFLPLTSWIFEHRMYLALSVVLTLLITAGYTGCQTLVRRRWWSAQTATITSVGLVALMGGVFRVLTIERNQTYHSAAAIWQDTIAVAPKNTMSSYLCGLALEREGRLTEALDYYQRDLDAYGKNLGVQYPLSATNSRWAVTYYNRGSVLARLGRYPEAIEHYEQAIQIKPNYANAHNNWGAALESLGRWNEAIEHYRQAIAINPQHINAHNNLFVALVQTGRIREAVEIGRQADRLAPNQPKLIATVAWLLATHDAAEGGNPSQALQWAGRAMALTRGRDGECVETMAAAYAAIGHFAEAIALATKARQAAQAAGFHSLVERFDQQLSCYRSGKPYREPPLQTARKREQSPLK